MTDQKTLTRALAIAKMDLEALKTKEDVEKYTESNTFMTLRGEINPIIKKLVGFTFVVDQDYVDVELRCHRCGEPDNKGYIIAELIGTHNELTKKISIKIKYTAFMEYLNDSFF